MIQTPTTISQWAIWLVVACGVIGIAYVAIGVTGVVIPQFVIYILWIAAAVIFAVFIIKLITQMTSTP